MKAKGKGRSNVTKGRTVALGGLVAGIVAVTVFTDSRAEERLSSPRPAMAQTLQQLVAVRYLSDGSYPEASQFSQNHALADVLMPVSGFLQAPVYHEAVAVSRWAPTVANIDEELHCLALNIYHEARNEPATGKAAVAHVVMNRVADSRFPDTACAVIRQGGAIRKHRCQFSWWCDGLSDQPLNRRSWEATQTIAYDVYWGVSQDPTEGALWYHADYVSPYWSRVFSKGPKIGLHIFYTPRKAPVQVASSG